MFYSLITLSGYAVLLTGWVAVPEADDGQKTLVMMYLLLANFYLGIFYMLYHGLLRKETFFQRNRVLPVLVGMLLFSVACNQATKDNHSTAETAQNATEDTAETPVTESLTLTLNEKDATGKPLIESPEILAEPPGGMKSFMNYVAKNYIYPEEALEAEVNGMIHVAFVIDEAGELNDIKIVRDLGYGTGDAAVQLLQDGPKWSPAIHRGKPVPTSYTLPIRLNLSN